MGTMGLALPWKARISSTLRERGTRVEPSEHFAGGHSPAVVGALSEDAALAAACRSGDLRAYERLYAMHGARMKNLARNVLGNPIDAEDAVQETFLKVQRILLFAWRWSARSPSSRNISAMFFCCTRSRVSAMRRSPGCWR